MTTLDLSNITNATRVFNGCSTYTNDETPIRKFVQVTLPTSCRSYTEMFRDSIMLSSLPSLRSAGAQDLSYMFANGVINQTSVEIPATYF